MSIKPGSAVCAALLVGTMGCAAQPSQRAVDTTSPTEATVAARAPAAPRTLDLRYKVKPQTDKLFSVTLPRQRPGGTLVTWSAYLSGIGAVATPSDPLKAECYVVQATGKSFDDRVFYVADDSTLSTGDDVSLSGSGVVDSRKGKQLTFECELDENRPEPIPGLQWQTIPKEPIQVTLTPLPAYEQTTRAVR